MESFSNSTHLSSQTLNGPSKILSMFILSLTFFLGLPGNGLVLWVAGLKMKRTVNTVWFLHLTLADFLCCLSLPFSLSHMVLQGHWPYGFFLCKLIPSIIILNMFASVFLLTAISLDRCLMVYRPIWCQNHRNVRSAFVICVCIWALAFAMCIPVFIYRKTFADNNHTRCSYDFSYYEYNYYPDLLENNSLLEFPQFPTDNLEPSSFQANDHTWIAATILLGSQTSQGSSGDAEVANQHWMPTPATPTGFPSGDHRTNIPENSTNFQLVPSPSSNYTELMNTFQDDYWDQLMPENQGSIPVVAMTISRSVLGFLVPFIIMVICYSLIVFRMTKSNLARSSNKTFRVTVVVVMVFLVCWTPYHIIGILLMYIDSSTPLGQALVSWDHLSIALASANSCFNPFLYAFLGKDFRKKAKQSMRGILEAAFNEELTHSTNCTQDRGISKVNEMNTGV